jgi:hypothetical protein
MGTVIVTLLSSGLGGVEEVAVSSTSESVGWGVFLFHNGNEYDFVRTIGNLEREEGLVFGIRTHSL